MSFFLGLCVHVHIYAYLERKFKNKEVLEKEKGVRGNKGIKGLRDTLREIDEKSSKNDSSDKKK